MAAVPLEETTLESRISKSTHGNLPLHIYVVSKVSFRSLFFWGGVILLLLSSFLFRIIFFLESHDLISRNRHSKINNSNNNKKQRMIYCEPRKKQPIKKSIDKTLNS